jgi:hypothetical protein
MEQGEFPPRGQGHLAKASEPALETGVSPHSAANMKLSRKAMRSW